MDTPNTPEIAGLLTVVQRESVLLAPYAMHTRDSRGRKFPESEHPYRGIYQRDRDRIIHSSAYRRLSGKMQVFTGEMGDYHRTRLTHTQEVASIARTIGRALRLNEDLIEALALFHDIGHPPFGHAGEDVLNECLVDHGGFSHNRYGLTLAEELEIRYTQHRGLNLSHEVLDGQADRVDKQAEDRKPLLEVQLVDAADSVTYDAHDVDDAVKLGLVTLEDLSETQLIRDVISRVKRRWTDLNDDLLRKAVVKDMIDMQVGNLLQHCGNYLMDAEFDNSEAARKSDFRVGPDPELTEAKSELERFLYARVYRHPQIVEVRNVAQSQLREAFHGFMEKPHLLPRHYQRRAEEIGLHRTVGDYLAGMTDRFFRQQHERLFSE